MCCRCLEWEFTNLIEWRFNLEYSFCHKKTILTSRVFSLRTQAMPREFIPWPQLLFKALHPIRSLSRKSTFKVPKNEEPPSYLLRQNRISILATTKEIKTGKHEGYHDIL